jgi:hypothetical protein
MPSGTPGGLDVSRPGRYPADIAFILSAVEHAPFSRDKYHHASWLAGGGPWDSRNGLSLSFSVLRPLNGERIGHLIDALIDEDELVYDDAAGWPAVKRSTVLLGWEEMDGPPPKEADMECELDFFLNATLDKQQRVYWEPIEAWQRYAGVVRAIVDEAHALSLATKSPPPVETSRQRFIDFVCGTWRPTSSADIQGIHREAWNVPAFCEIEAARQWETWAGGSDATAGDEEAIHYRASVDAGEALELRRAYFKRFLGEMIDDAGLAPSVIWTKTGKPEIVLAPRRGEQDHPSDPPRQSAQPWSSWGLVVAELVHAVTSPRGYLGCNICERYYPKFEGTRSNRRLCGPRCTEVHRVKYGRGEYRAG